MKLKMALIEKKVWKELNRRKEAMLIGAAVGFIAATYTINQGYDLTSLATAGKGLLDTIMSRSAPIEIAKYKVYGVFIFLGAAIGYFVDCLMDYLNIGKKTRRR
jgi:hypothetical protein